MLKVSILSAVGVFVFGWAGAVVASSIDGYVPPDNGRQQTTESAGSRGCPEKLPKLAIAAPKNHLGRTIESHPSFFFWVSEIPSQPIRISLTDVEAENSTWTTEVVVRTPGLVKVTMPESAKGLQSQRTYALAAVVPCGERPSQGESVRILLERVEPSLALRQQLDAVGGAEKAKILAQQGIWYDALTVSFEHNRPFFESLLRQIEFAFLNRDVACVIASGSVKC
jgi:hypothetical protein